MHPPLTSWTDARLPPCFAEFYSRCQAALRLEAPRNVQAQVWSSLLQGRNAVVVAPTGSGKTLAYSLPLVPHVLAARADGTRGAIALVLAPTRELVAQIASACRPFRRLFDVQVGAAYGGGTEAGSGDVAGCDVVVSTPARLMDLACRFEVSLANVSMVVVDEVDRMVAMGLKEQVGRTQLVSCLTSAGPIRPPAETHSGCRRAAPSGPD